MQKFRHIIMSHLALTFVFVLNMAIDSKMVLLNDDKYSSNFCDRKIITVLHNYQSF